MLAGDSVLACISVLFMCYNVTVLSCVNVLACHTVLACISLFICVSVFFGYPLLGAVIRHFAI